MILDQYLASSRAVNAATARCYQYGAAGPWQVDETWRSLLTAGDDDEVFMTISLNVTPKKTEQHLLVRSGKLFEAEVTNNRYCTVESNYQGSAENRNSVRIRLTELSKNLTSFRRFSDRNCMQSAIRIKIDQK